MTKSIYDQLNASGTIAKQRVVETFTGDALDTDRWSTNNVRGTNTYAMADEVDGGFKITSGSTQYDGGSITFNNIRQFSPTASEVISVTKISNLTDLSAVVGFSDNQDSPTFASAANGAVMDQGNYSAYVRLGTSQTGTNNNVDTTTSRSTNWTTSKISMTLSSVILTVNGLTGATSTGNSLPTVKLQPIFIGFTNSATAHSYSIKYMECYNT